MRLVYTGGQKSLSAQKYYRLRRNAFIFLHSFVKICNRICMRNLVTLVDYVFVCVQLFLYMSALSVLKGPQWPSG